MTTANKITLVSDRVARAKAFLLTQFKDKPNINAFVEVVVEELQQLENALTDLQNVRTLEGSYGVYLDEIGETLKVNRGNYNDNDYKNAIKIAIAKKTSSATAEDILFIVELITGDPEVVLTNNYPYLLELTGFLFCLAEDPSGLEELAKLFPLNTRIRFIQQFGKSFKFGTPDRGFGSGSTLNSLAYVKNGISDSDRFTSVPTELPPVLLNRAPYVISVPIIDGDNNEGSTLTCTEGEWGGTGVITITYQWLRDNVDIAAETSNIYLLTATDLSTSISCRVSATNAYGSTSQQTNNIYINATAPDASVLKEGLGVTTNIIAITPWDNTGSETATATLTFNSDGTTDITKNATVINDQWLTTTGGGLGAGYTVSYVVVSGTPFTNLNPEALHTLSSGINFTKTITSDGGALVTGTYIFTIRQIADGSIVESKQTTITANVVDAYN